MNQMSYDITVLGGGPGGYVAAIAAAQKGKAGGKKVCLVEDGKLGGVCLNEGCIPTKTLIKTANIYLDVLRTAEFAVEGINPEQVKVSMPKLQERKSAVVKQLTDGIRGLLRGNNVSLVEGRARFIDANTIMAGDKKTTSEYFIIATGSNAFMPPFIAQEGKNTIITSREALQLREVPKSIAIIGGGVIGVEFAYLLNALGSKVTVLELMDNILPMVDEEISALGRKQMEISGIVFHTGAKVTKVKDNEVFFEYKGEVKTVSSDMVLMAVGRVPNMDGLGAEEIGIKLDKNAIAVDEVMRTNMKNIYAIGDVNGKVMLAHTASHEGIVAVDNIFGKISHINYDGIPTCIYLEPQIACIGITEKQAEEKYNDVKVGKFPMLGNGKSLVEGETSGMVKVIIDGQLGEILGVHMCGSHVTEMIAELSAAISLEATAEEMIKAIHPHPTISEAIPEAFMAAYGGPINWL